MRNDITITYIDDTVEEYSYVFTGENRLLVHKDGRLIISTDLHKSIPHTDAVALLAIGLVSQPITKGSIMDTVEELDFGGEA